jgi:ABC-type glycerol-3-phosphate transport system substrate-binding protein
VEYWEKWGGREWEAMAATARAFNAHQDRYEVVTSPAGDWSAGPDLPKFLAALDAGRQPDLIGLEDQQLADLVSQSAVLPLDEVPGFDPGNLDPFDDRFIALASPGGRPHGVPIAADVVTLYVDLDAVRGTRFETGVPTDINGFTGGLHETASRGGPGFVPAYPGWWPHLWPLLFGGGWFDERGRFTPDRPENVRAYEWIAALRNLAGDEYERSLNPLPRGNPFARDVALIADGDWIVQRLAGASDVSWDVAPLPSLSGEPAALILADVLCIPRGARCAAGAAEFICFASRPANVEALARAHAKIASLARWSADFVAGHPNPRLGSLRTILNTARLLQDPSVPGWLRHLADIKEAFAAIWSRYQEPRQALAALRDA